MANANIPRGLVPVRDIHGKPYNGAANVYHVPSDNATALFVGDPVVTITDASDANGVQDVVIAAAAGTTTMITGVVVSLAFFEGSPVLRDSGRYLPASTEGYVMVADDPGLLFEIQEDGAMGVGAVGRKSQLIAGTGSTVTGWSGWQLDSSEISTTSTDQLHIAAPVLRADNDPTLTNAKWLVSINTGRHTFNTAASGI